MQPGHKYTNSAVLITVILCGFAAGCGTAYKVTPVTSTRKAYVETWTERPRWYERLYRADRNIYLNPYTYNPANPHVLNGKSASTNRIGSFFWIAVNGTNEEARMIARNQLQNAIMRLSDQMTASHLSELKSTENFGNILLGAATLGLTGGASVAAPVTAKAFSASATGTGGARELFNNQVYRNALLETLIGSIESDRQEFAMTITRKQTNSILKYDAESAIRDANEYHQRGSFYHGLALIREAAEKSNQDKKTGVKQQLSGSSTNAPSR